MTFLLNPFMLFGGEIIFQVKTDNPGVSNSTSFLMPLRQTSGTYNYTVEWGDGTVESFTGNTNRTHDYGIAGTYTVRVTGTFTGNFYFNNTNDGTKIIKVLTHTLDLGQRLDNVFYGCSNLTELNVSNWDTSNVTNFNLFANGCTNLQSLDVSNWDTSNVTNFPGFALGCTNLQSLDVSNWDTSNVTNFTGFANNCTNLQSLDVSNWDTSNVTNFTQFALGCTNLQSLDVSNWDTSNVTSFIAFVLGCTNLQNLDVSNWDTSNVTNFTQFAQSCTNLTTLTVGNAFDNTIATNCENAFWNCALNQSSVDAILVSFNTAGTSNGTLTISGGTNATPSATGQAATDALRARGWTVILNGY
jgi:surface protein